MKRTLPTLVILACLTVSLAGCSDSSTSTNNTTAGGGNANAPSQPMPAPGGTDQAQPTAKN